MESCSRLRGSLRSLLALTLKACSRARRSLPAVALAALALVAACAAPAAQWHDPIAEPSESVSPSPAEPEEITLAFAGDVNFMGRTLKLLANPQTAFGPIADVLEQADLTVVNLETAVTDRGQPQPKTFHFRAPVTAYAALHAAGIDAVSIANNHALDYGQVGLLDTLDSAAAAKMPVFGAGRNVTDAYAPWLTEVRGVKVALLGMSQVHELSGSWKATDTRPGIAMAFDSARAVAAVQAARRQADLVIIYMHWGIEGNSCPSSEMKSFASKMASAGADIVLGTHAHTLLADGWTGNTYVHFGLGNFLWYLPSWSTDTGVLRLTIDKRVVISREFLPATVSSTGQPIPLSGAAAERLRQKVAGVQRCTGLRTARP